MFYFVLILKILLPHIVEKKLEINKRRGIIDREKFNFWTSLNAKGTFYDECIYVRG